MGETALFFFYAALISSSFNRSSPPEVQEAFRITIMNMLGSLPSSLYPMEIRTVTNNVVQLMQTCVMTGYMFRNAQYRFSLMKSLQQEPSLSALEPTEVDIIGAELQRNDTDDSDIGPNVSVITIEALTSLNRCCATLNSVRFCSLH